MNTPVYLFHKKNDLPYLCVAFSDVSQIMLQLHSITVLNNFFLVILGYGFIGLKIGVALLGLEQALGAKICDPQL